MTPTVGRIVHFYIDAASAPSKSIGAGPYAAIITEVLGDGEDAPVNLKAFYPFDAIVDHGCVRHKDFDLYSGRYWDWPPKV